MATKVKIHTTEGDIIVRLYDETPKHRDNFVKLAKQGYFDGTLFHRVIKDFMIQGGDPDSKNAPKGKMLGTGGPDYTIPAEFVYPQLYHKRGALSAARLGDEVNPNRESSGSQFYIVWGKTYKDAELKQMERQMAMQQEQNIFNQLAKEHHDEIMNLRRNRDRQGLMALQDQLADETKKRSREMGTPRFTEEQRTAYTTIGGTPFLDNQYTVFGEVEEGLDVVEKIQNCETLRGDRPKEDISMTIEVLRPYKAIALDLDGTLTNHDKVVTPKTREALLRAESEGAVIILASGRPTYGIEPVAECLEMEKRGGYILSYNGGNIVNAKTGEKLFAQSLPDDVIPVLYQYAKEHNHALLGYDGNEIITEMPDDQYVREESRINKMNIRHVDNLLDALEPHPTKLLMTGDPSDMLQAEKELVEKLGDKMDIFRSAPFFLELVPKGIDKAQSLLRLLDKLNLTPADMIAFGDGYNDLSMLKLAGMGVAMANAAPEVRDGADYVTLSNEEDGVAAALEHLGM